KYSSTKGQRTCRRCHLLVSASRTKSSTPATIVARLLLPLYHAPWKLSNEGRALAVVAARQGRTADVAIGAGGAVLAGRRLNSTCRDGARDLDRRRFRRLGQFRELIPIERLDRRAILQRRDRRELAQVDVLGAEEAAASRLAHGIVTGGGARQTEQPLHRQQVERHLQALAPLHGAEIHRLAQLIVQHQRAAARRVAVHPVYRAAEGDGGAAVPGLQAQRFRAGSRVVDARQRALRPRHPF